MRIRLYTVPWWFSAVCALAQGPVINEVVPGGGASPDWIEVYNPGNKAIDLLGHVVVTASRSHRIDASIMLAGGGCQVLWCDRHPEKGPDHLDLKLPRSGGSVLLIDPDRVTVRDLYSWRDLPAGVSLGRLSDGSAEWGYFAKPTPGGPNRSGDGVRRLLSAPEPAWNVGKAMCAPPEGGTVRYTLDGRIPHQGSPIWDADLDWSGPGVITCRAFAPDALPSPATSLTVPEKETDDFVAIRIDPDSLYNAKRGILTGGDVANYARSGRGWRRDAQVEWHSGGSTRREDVGLAVSGSGTRGLPKKNYKLYGEQEIILRADATPHAFLRNLFIETIARPHGGVDIQPGVPMPLYVNGTYEGLYRAMPAKNSAWVEELGGAESVDLIDGPGARALEGDDARHAELLAMLERGTPLDTLSALMEVTSLLDLACFDLYTGRADHDLNTRCWRPRERGGRWRWILFDMDLWAPPEERSLERMCSSTAPEAPYLPWLLEHDELRPRLLARLCAWLATSLATGRAETVADSLFAVWAPQMRMDHARWKDTLLVPAPDEAIAALRAHVGQRPGNLLEQVGQHTGLALREITVRVDPPLAGTITMEHLPLTDDRSAFSAFAGVPIHLSAHAQPGYTFSAWEGTKAKGPSIIVDPAKAKNLRALYRKAGGTE